MQINCWVKESGLLKRKKEIFLGATKVTPTFEENSRCHKWFPLCDNSFSTKLSGELQIEIFFKKSSVIFFNVRMRIRFRLTISTS